MINRKSLKSKLILNIAESEPVAGFITEYSTIYFSIILLTEYASIHALTHLIIIEFSIHPHPLVFM